jgi:DNA polymerase-3 subunit epsilon
MKRKLVVVDTETGGLNPESHSILSVAALILDGDKIVDEYYTLINEGECVVAEGSALKVNGLTMERVRSEGVSPEVAVKGINDLLTKHALRGATLVAHNAAFDVGFMKRLYRLAGQDYEKRFAYRHLCTVTGALLLDQAGIIVLPSGSASLDNLIKLFGIEADREKHDALVDARACASILSAILRSMRP